ncbi:short-chain dehydrogenase/reductase SDR [Rhizobium grahamii]|uniref:Short-chain dehydrogenase/reductase SDR n=1 Tax=Rhizobium grahamii CCGE 502 TaxID=990285 RepID=S3HHQ2_9HYPH|nr:short-chain dehydrogenase/reductase SDR [Rhizobium grahamii]EPE98299.1 short-chain dehydrogenase/reductase SDR [Rhizobium grahamii CCGE 502]
MTSNTADSGRTVFITGAGHGLGQALAVLSLHPGWVRTDMGGERAMVAARHSANGLKRIIDGASMADSGSFYAYDGKQVAW